MKVYHLLCAQELELVTKTERGWDQHFEYLGQAVEDCPRCSRLLKVEETTVQPMLYTKLAPPQGWIDAG